MPLDLLLAHGYFLSLDAAEQRVMRHIHRSACCICRRT
jgi:hypothetical protein